MRTDEPVMDINETHAGAVYGISEGAPEQVRTLIEGLQAPKQLSREVTWGEHLAMDAIYVEVLWDEATQRATYSVPGAQGRSVALSDLAEELGRDWEHYLADSAPGRDRRRGGNDPVRPAVSHRRRRHRPGSRTDLRRPAHSWPARSDHGQLTHLRPGPRRKRAGQTAGRGGRPHGFG